MEGTREAPLAHTTPEPITLHRMLARLRAEGVTHAAMEASSHGLAQRRVDGITPAGGGFHEPQPGSPGLPRHAGGLLRGQGRALHPGAARDRTAVINTEDPHGPEMAELAGARGQSVIAVGRGADAELRIEAQRFGPEGQTLRFAWQGAGIRSILVSSAASRQATC